MDNAKKIQLIEALDQLGYDVKQITDNGMVQYSGLNATGQITITVAQKSVAQPAT